MKRSLLLFTLLVACSNVSGYETVPIKSIDKEQFHPIVLSIPSFPSASPVLVPKPAAEAISKPTPKPKKPTLQGTRRSAILGKASWYCSNSIPICHHSYPPGSYVAAACGKLRRAMGPNWRGRTVNVRANGRSVNVKLVDWCGSTTKTIDLYYAPMRRLGGTGVLTVRISW